MYDNSIRVPLIVYDPRHSQKNQVDEMVLNIDVPSTIVDLAEVDLPPSWQGKSLMPLVNQEVNTIERDTVLIEHLWDFEHIPPSEGVRTEEWKYFRYVNDKTLEELYHLKNDPQEKNNLIGDEKYTSVVKALKEKLEELIKRNSNVYRLPPKNLIVTPSKTSERKVKMVDLKPEFGWDLPSTYKFQKAYQILVASKKSILDSNNSDLWNSQRVESNALMNIVYQGKSLEKGKTYYWKVRIWDEDNRLVDYSGVESFTLASGR